MIKEEPDPLLEALKNHGYLRHLLVFCESEGKGKSLMRIAKN
jgi:hypothetical protein